MILASTIFETGVKIATKIRREKNENCVEFSFHSISGFPRKQTQDHLHFWKARRRDRRMLDKALIRGFYEPELVHAQWCFHSLEILKTLKKTLGGSFFVQFSLLRPKKYKTNHRRTLLASEEVRRTFFALSQEGPKKVKLPPTQRSFKSSIYSLSFMSMKEGKITRKDPFGYEKWGLQK